MNSALATLILMFSLSFSLPGNTSSEMTSEPEKCLSQTFSGGNKEYCNLYGLVFVESIPGMGDYKVFVEEDEAFSDMLIYRETDPTFLQGAGVWYFTDIRETADFSISFETTQAFADFTICYTQFKSLAGCRR